MWTLPSFYPKSVKEQQMWARSGSPSVFTCKCCCFHWSKPLPQVTRFSDESLAEWWYWTTGKASMVRVQDLWRAEASGAWNNEGGVGLGSWPHKGGFVKWSWGKTELCEIYWSVLCHKVIYVLKSSLSIWSSHWISVLNEPRIKINGSYCLLSDFCSNSIQLRSKHSFFFETQICPNKTNQA